MNSLKNISGILIIVILLFSCKNEYWEDHYEITEHTVNSNVWDAIKQDSSLSTFVYYVNKYQFDTLFIDTTITKSIYTLFIPNNTAFALFTDSADITRAILNYCISEYYIQSKNIQGIRKIQTLGEKYAFFSNTPSGYAFDGIPLNFESPLYINGKYFTMNSIAYPKYNLYEYFAVSNPVLKKYIDSKDSIILDKLLSRPLGFDSLGNTIYDTVAIDFNIFEEEYFPVKHEMRYKTATFVFPKSDDYNAALTTMAQTMGGKYIDYRDIPMDWQNKILIPYLLEHGTFENLVEESEFVLNPLKDDTLKMKNILGDSVAIFYTPTEKTLCSNGYAYNYSNFEVPDTLWASALRFEGEHLVRNIGANRWAWKEGIKITGNTSFAPLQDYIVGASKDSTLRVMLTPNKYTGSYSVEFNIDNLFPRKFLMIVRTCSNYGGKYNIFVNDSLVKNIDYTALSGAFYNSVIPGIRYLPNNRRYINFDCWVNNLKEYGKARVRFEYKGPSAGAPYSALLIDYIDFKPY